ncbi:MAG: methyltransferase domain-containing protein [Silvibacterium sp.]
MAEFDLATAKAAAHRTWTAGDFGQIARYAANEGEAFVERLGLGPGIDVLDVACGTGNLAIPAARTGAWVTGVDIAPNLLEQARRRAAEESLDVAFDEGDAEALPYPDGRFDVVMSMFGAMFAPRPEVVARELARVCRAGGRVAMANWNPAGGAGRMSAIARKYLPPPEGIPSPALWGNPAVATARLEAVGFRVTTAMRAVELDFPFSPRETVAFFREYFGPVRMIFERLDEEAQAGYAADLEAFWNESNSGGPGRTQVVNEYLEVVGVKN